MSNGPVLLASLAAGDGVRITSVTPLAEYDYLVQVERIVGGRTLGRARFPCHTETPNNIGAVLSQQVMAASGADPRFDAHILSGHASGGYSEGPAGAVRELRALLGDRYELYMQTYLDAAAASSGRLAGLLEREAAHGSAKSAGNGCALVLLVMVGATVAATMISQVRG